jgi:two-component system chemotaxis response regulator CheB
MQVEAGNVYIAPGDYHMKVARKGTSVIAMLDQSEPENSCRPAVDVLFRSAADVWGGSALAVILTGMGRDGLRGIERLRALGSYVVAQDEASSVVWGMPGAVVTAGLADSVVDLKCVVPEIQRHL